MKFNFLSALKNKNNYILFRCQFLFMAIALNFQLADFQNSWINVHFSLPLSVLEALCGCLWYRLINHVTNLTGLPQNS